MLPRVTQISKQTAYTSDFQSIIKANLGPENGCHLVDTSSESPPVAAPSSNAHCSIHPRARRIQQSLSSAPRSQWQSSPTLHLSPFRVAGASQVPLENQSPMVYTQGGTYTEGRRRPVGLTALSSLASSFLQVTLSACHPFSEVSPPPPTSTSTSGLHLASSSPCYGARITLSAFPPLPFPPSCQDSPDRFIYLPFRSCL